MKELNLELVEELIDIISVEAVLRPSGANSFLLKLLKKLEHPKLLATYEIESILQSVARGDALNSDWKFATREGAIRLQLPLVYEAYLGVEVNKKQTMRFAGMQLKDMEQEAEQEIARLDAVDARKQAAEAGVFAAQNKAAVEEFFAAQNEAIEDTYQAQLKLADAGDSDETI